MTDVTDVTGSDGSSLEDPGLLTVCDGTTSNVIFYIRLQYLIFTNGLIPPTLSPPPPSSLSVWRLLLYSARLRRHCGGR